MKMVADRIGKGRAYALGLVIASLAVSSGFLLPYGKSPLIYLVAFFAGMGFSAQWVCPWSMLPDVVEFDEAKTGERREGIFYGMWAFITKFTNALGIAASGWSLALFGYIPGIAQSQNALMGIRLFFCIVPSVVILLSLPLLIWYPITRQSHARLLAELKAQSASQEE